MNQHLEVHEPDSKAVLERIMGLYGFSRPRELANHFGIDESTLSKCKKGEREVPKNLIRKVKFDKNVSLDWLEYGEKPHLFDDYTRTEMQLGILSGLAKTSRLKLLPKEVLRQDLILLESAAALIIESIEERIMQKKEIA